MSFRKPLSFLSFGISLLVLASMGWAWGFVPDTWNTNQISAGAFYVPSSPYSGFTYFAYRPTNGYPVMGGGRYFAPGMYANGYLAPSYGFGYAYSNPYAYVRSPYLTTVDYYSGVPLHTTSDAVDGACFSFGC